MATSPGFSFHALFNIGPGSGSLMVFFTLLLVSGCNSAIVDLQAPAAGTLRFASYNVHYIDLTRQSGAWSADDWDRRKLPLDMAFKALSADIVAFQEMESFAGGDDNSTNLTLDWLLTRNPSYSAAAVGDAHEFPSTQPILYRHERLSLEDQGWFFFSDEPEVIYSRTFNGSYPTFASWALFTERATGETFHVYNVHFDFKSSSNRRLSAELVASRLASLVASRERVFLVGDLNAWHGSRPVRILEDIGLTFQNVSGATWHFNRGLNFIGAIDHLAITAGLEPEGDPVVLRKRFGGEWPSDHYPVVGDFRLQSPL